MGNTKKPQCSKCKRELILYTGTVYARSVPVNNTELDIEVEAHFLYCKKCDKIRKVWQV
jgi:uncharacterized protein with PIN domain